MRKNVVRTWALLLVMLLLPALAMAETFAVVKGGRLNLRQSPSAQSVSLGKYATGTWVQVLSRGQAGFSYVKTLTGKTGYMSENYLDFGTSTGTSTSTGTVKYANGGYVNMRSGPSLGYSVVMRVTSGSVVTVVNDSYEWNYICAYVNGSTVYGYMHDSFIDRGGVTTSTVTTRNGGRVNLCSGPSSSFTSLGALASGTKVTVLLKGNGWYQISANGLTGFMSTEYLSGSGSTVGSNTGSSGTVSASKAWVNNPKSTQVLNLRETPSQSARSIGQYRNGTQVRVVSYGNTWCEVYVGTKHGYMMTRYLSFTGSPVPQQTPVYVYPVITPTPTPLVQYITPRPQVEVITPRPQVEVITPRPQVEVITPQPEYSDPDAPKAGTPGTLAVAAGSDQTTINVYRDAEMTQLAASYPAGKSVTILHYDMPSTMVLVGGQVGFVSIWNVNY